MLQISALFYFNTLFPGGLLAEPIGRERSRAVASGRERVAPSMLALNAMLALFALNLIVMIVVPLPPLVGLPLFPLIGLPLCPLVGLPLRLPFPCLASSSVTRVNTEVAGWLVPWFRLVLSGLTSEQII